MAVPKSAKSKEGKPMHYSVGALIKKDGKFLLIDRAVPPLGFAGVAGHIDKGEEAVEALKREVEEESGLKIESSKLLFEEELDWNWCSKGIKVHHWYLFECEASGELRRNVRETKAIGWYSPEEIKSLKLEPVWEYWFKKLGILG
ncbi:MAG: NUDIX domain-containing protein [Nanoarchaeota archaeon]